MYSSVLPRRTNVTSGWPPNVSRRRRCPPVCPTSQSCTSRIDRAIEPSVSNDRSSPFDGTAYTRCTCGPARSSSRSTPARGRLGEPGQPGAVGAPLRARQISGHVDDQMCSSAREDADRSIASDLVITELGTVSPARKLRFDAFGMVLPGGNTVAKPSDLASVTVTFRTTAPAFIGTPARPPTFKVTTENAAWAPVRWNWPSTVSPAGRLSSTRAGAASGRTRWCRRSSRRCRR